MEDVTLKNFSKKITYSSDPDPENKLVLSNESFIECIIQLKLINAIERLRLSLIK